VSALPRAAARVADFILSKLAVEDVDVIHTFICTDNAEAADRVQEAIFEGFALLACNPGLGRERHFRRRKNIRSWGVTEYPNYLIFYRELPNGSGVEIVRVLHGARNLDALFRE
jgi:toxin ParE1/3/4